MHFAGNTLVVCAVHVHLRYFKNVVYFTRFFLEREILLLFVFFLRYFKNFVCALCAVLYGAQRSSRRILKSIIKIFDSVTIVKKKSQNKGGKEGIDYNILSRIFEGLNGVMDFMAKG